VSPASPAPAPFQLAHTRTCARVRRMGSVNLVVPVESVRTIVSHTGGDTNTLHIPSLVAVAAALGQSLAACWHGHAC
jgi:hypothetical protein